MGTVSLSPQPPVPVLLSCCKTKTLPVWQPKLATIKAGFMVVSVCPIIHWTVDTQPYNIFWLFLFSNWLESVPPPSLPSKNIHWRYSKVTQGGTLWRHCKVDKQMKIFNSVKCKDGIWISNRDTCSDHCTQSVVSTLNYQEMSNWYFLVRSMKYNSPVSLLCLFSLLSFLFIHFDSQKLIFSFYDGWGPAICAKHQHSGNKTPTRERQRTEKTSKQQPHPDWLVGSY